MTATTMHRTRNDLRAPADSVVFLDVQGRRYLAADGTGTPEGSPAFQQAIRALYGVAYALKFVLKRTRGITAHIDPLEGLWTTESRGAFDAASRRHFCWTLLLAIPEEATDAEIEAAIEAATARDPAVPSLVRVESLAGGTVAQTLHIGPYETETRSIERLHAAIIEAGRLPAGRHHEIYLRDPRHTTRDRLQTILRQPVRAVS